MLLDNEKTDACLVQIVNITHKDGSLLEPNNWRQKLIGRITMCCFVGGIECMAPFFEGTVHLENGEVTSVNLHYRGNASVGPRPPVEVEPGVYDFETSTSVYRFRTLEQNERNLVLDAIHAAIQKEKEAVLRALEQNSRAENDVPAS